ncbi:polyprenyl synthetase family protein [Trueperella pecoris]|uniref:Polyprenyl synthetase family protein n=1 Tax=Trueperella pecoris TaxID=2733571 RepID=A0A7M1R2K7_9ACTO|nr:polyprenyl synthetase family protein [Trueperella pecoris]QOR48520.1 polyprenyl synthetase family protein [Trueperella pecoris]
MDNFRAAVTDRLTRSLEESAPFVDDHLARIVWREFITPARELAASGKRTRALLIAAGHEACGGKVPPVHAGVAAELYQMSALVHDDIIDESHTRRGVPAAHRNFTTSHRGLSMLGDSAIFGTKAAILLGDFLLSLAAVEIEMAEASDAESLARARRLFHEMTAETAYGQYLDLRAESTCLNDDREAAINESLLVLRHKSARYSVELPLMIGGALAGASESDIARLSELGRPLGTAFQLRDDELGIFGSPEDTGKPAGGDITEGKHTVLLALTRARASDADRKFVDDALGRPLSSDDVSSIRRIVVDSGAFTEHEDMITAYERTAVEVAAQFTAAPILGSVMAELENRRA